MCANMDSASGYDFIPSMAVDVTKCLGRFDFFEKLDSLLSPEDRSIPSPRCRGTYRLSESILVGAGSKGPDVSDIFTVLRAKGG